MCRTDPALGEIHCLNIMDLTGAVPSEINYFNNMDLTGAVPREINCLI